MSSINVVVPGRVSYINEVKEFESGAAVLNFGLCNNKAEVDEEGNKKVKTAFFSVALWRPKTEKARAWFQRTFDTDWETIATRLAKGDFIKVEGELQRKKVGEKVYNNLKANCISLLKAGKNHEPVEEPEESTIDTVEMVDEEFTDHKGMPNPEPEDEVGILEIEDDEEVDVDWSACLYTV